MSDEQTTRSKDQPTSGGGAGGAGTPPPQPGQGGDQGEMHPVDQGAQEEAAQERKEGGYSG